MEPNLHTEVHMTCCRWGPVGSDSGHTAEFWGSNLHVESQVGSEGNSSEALITDYIYIYRMSVGPIHTDALTTEETGQSVQRLK